MRVDGNVLEEIKSTFSEYEEEEEGDAARTTYTVTVAHHLHKDNCSMGFSNASFVYLHYLCVSGFASLFFVLFQRSVE